MTAWIAGAEIKGVVFIDSMVPDLQTLLGGVAPGERAFVLDTSAGGLEQIAAILTANNLTGVGSIAIVGHGASGSINVGTTVLNDGDLAAHAAALKAIGAAVKPGGSLDLYSCDTAAGPQGRAFIADLSKAANVTVDASTHEIGKTAAGESWTLDATAPARFGSQAVAMPASPAAQAQTASTSVASTNTPFTADATQSYEGMLAAATATGGQLFGVAPNLQTNAQSYYLDSGSSTLKAISTTDGGADAVAVDPALKAIFELKAYNQPNVGDVHGTLYIGSLAAGAAAPVMSASFEQYYEANFDSETINAATDTGNSIAVDTADHLLFIPIGSDNINHNGLLEMSYSADASGTVTVNGSTIKFLETSAGGEPPTFFSNGAVYDYKTKNVYIDDVLDGVSSGEENGIYRISTTATAGSAAGQPVALYNNAGGDRIYGLAFDAKNNRLFFATSTPTNSTYTADRNALYMLASPDTASNAMPTALTYASGVVAPTYGLIQGVAYDDNANVLYVSNNYVADGNQAPPNNTNYQRSEIDRLQLNAAGTQVTGVTAISYTTLSSTPPGSIPFASLTYDPLSNLTVAGTTAAVSKTTPATLLASAPTITDYKSGGYLQSATVTITDASTGAVVSGDTLGLVKGGTFTAFTSTATAYVDNGHTFNVSYAGGVLTIANQLGSAGENTIASFQQVLGDVQYRNNSTNTNNRTATFQVNNGAIGNPSASINTQSFTLAVAKPPVVAANGFAIADLAGATAMNINANAAFAGDSDPQGGTLTATSVQTASGTAGTIGSALTGTYGALTLQGNGAYGYTANNANAIAKAATGAHPVDSYIFGVSNAGGTTNEVLKVTIDRVPITTADAANATELGPAATGNVLTNDTDPDGDGLTVASVSFNGTAGTVGQSVTGTYGTLTLNANGTYSYTADNALAYATNSPPRTDSFSYTDSDGLGGTSAATPLTFTVTCFATGTRIRVARGEAVADVPVEALRVGDLAVTATGEHRPIRWIGSRLTHCRHHPRPHEAMPVRVAAHAFAPNRPARDLLVSPGHSLCLDVVGEVLIPAVALVNGTTIVQEDVDSVTYWHVELDSHDILLAENMPAESYIDMGNRGFFAESDVVDLDALPDAQVVTHADFCRPFHDEGALVQVVRAQLAARAETLGWRLEERGLGDLHLMVDGVRVEPRVRGLAARFTVPAGAEAVWLVSASTVPAAITAGSPDRRALGLCVAALTLDDGFGAPRRIAVDDPRLCVGFHDAERDGDVAWRWTAGRARLPASLWEGLDDTFLRVDLAGSALPRWVAPVPAQPGVAANPAAIAA